MPAAAHPQRPKNNRYRLENCGVGVKRLAFHAERVLIQGHAVFRALAIAVIWLTAMGGGAADGPPETPRTNPPPPRAVRPLTDPFDLELPDMNFRQAPLAEILDWIRDRSREADPSGVGVSLILKDDARGTLAATTLTLRLTRPTVRRALDLLATTAGLYIRRERNVAVIERSRITVPAR